MSYEHSRDAAQMDRLAIATSEFILRWKSRGSPAERRVLFLFPGGTGSALFRARKPYDDAGPALQTFKFGKVWADVGTFLGDALDLKMRLTATGWRDRDDHIIIADGAVELACVTPYDDFTLWCDHNHIDWFIFGYDWRRPVGDAATFFLSRFLPVFRQSVMDAVCADPLANYFVVGHSLGGMVVNEIARRPGLPARPAHAITIGTPFYGYSGQIHRWFERDSYFILMSEMSVIRTVTSFPGLYELPLLDASTYQANRQDLGPPGTFPLVAYPSFDAANTGTAIDPYAPGAGRYPDTTGFNTAALASGLDTLHRLTLPLPAWAPPFTALRGIQTDNDDNPRSNTPSAVRWTSLSGPFDPSDGSPITDTDKVPGDGTQPAWTARLVHAPHHDILHPGIDHMYLMEHPDIHAALAALL